MTVALQIITLVAAFILVLMLGVIFDTGYFQAAIIAKETLGDRPLPGITSVLYQNHRALSYLIMIPWIGFAGLPFFVRSREYFDQKFFLVRFAAFAAVETLLTVFLLCFLVLPFIPFYTLMDGRRNSLFESIVILGFWIGIAVTMVLIFVRVVASARRSAAAAADDTEAAGS